MGIYINDNEIHNLYDSQPCPRNTIELIMAIWNVMSYCIRIFLCMVSFKKHVFHFNKKLYKINLHLLC